MRCLDVYKRQDIFRSIFSRLRWSYRASFPFSVMLILVSGKTPLLFSISFGSSATIHPFLLRYEMFEYSPVSYTHLSEANLDFSVFPLWCGALSVQADERIVRQLIYHTLRLAQNAKMDCALKAALFTKELIAQANLFHRVESGDVERITDESLAYHTRKPGAAEEPEPLEKKD